MLDHFFRVNLRLCGGELNGVCREFCINLTPGEILNVKVTEDSVTHCYVLLEGKAIRKAIEQGVVDPEHFANALYVYTSQPDCSLYN